MKMGFALPATGDAEIEAIWGKKHKQKYAKKLDKNAAGHQLGKKGQKWSPCLNCRLCKQVIK